MKIELLQNRIERNRILINLYRIESTNTFKWNKIEQMKFRMIRIEQYIYFNRIE